MPASRSYHSSPGPAHQHAIVIGAGMAGLVTARILANHFEQVTIVERDHPPDAPAARKGVPQAHHIHILLRRGLALLEAYFPGLRDDLLAHGAVTVHWPLEALWLLSTGWSPRFYHRGFELISCSRNLLEWRVRRRVLARDQIRLLEGRDVVGLLPSPDRTRIVGVRHVARHPAGDGRGSADGLRADLVVDASGRNSRTPRLLAALGYPVPRETTVASFLGYASRLYDRPVEFHADWKVIYLQTKPPSHMRLGAIIPVEEDRWLVGLGGVASDCPPTDERGFLAFAQGLRSPILHKVIQAAEPLGPIHGYRRTENRLRHYDRLARFPERLLVVGDALCTLNPVYGQGMTVAAMQAAVLDQCLQEQRQRRAQGDLTGLSRRFQPRAARTALVAWLIATGEDCRYPTTVGARPNMQTRVMHRYIDRVLRAATEDAEVNRVFADVVNMTAPPTALFQPSILARVLRPPRPAPASDRPLALAPGDPPVEVGAAMSPPGAIS